MKESNINCPYVEVTFAEKRIPKPDSEDINDYLLSVFSSRVNMVGVEISCNRCGLYRLNFSGGNPPDREAIKSSVDIALLYNCPIVRNLSPQ